MRILAENHAESDRIIETFDPVAIIQTVSNIKAETPMQTVKKTENSNSSKQKNTEIERNGHFQTSESANTLYFGLPFVFKHYPPPKITNFETTDGSAVRLIWVHPPKTVTNYEILLAPFSLQQVVDEEVNVVLNLTNGFNGYTYWFNAINLKNYARILLSGSHNDTLLPLSSSTYDVRLRALYRSNQSVWASAIVAPKSQQNSGLVFLTNVLRLTLV